MLKESGRRGSCVMVVKLMLVGDSRLRAES